MPLRSFFLFAALLSLSASCSSFERETSNSVRSVHVSGYRVESVRFPAAPEDPLIVQVEGHAERATNPQFVARFENLAGETIGEAPAFMVKPFNSVRPRRETRGEQFHVQVPRGLQYDHVHIAERRP